MKSPTASLAEGESCGRFWNLYISKFKYLLLQQRLMRPDLKQYHILI